MRLLPPRGLSLCFIGPALRRVTKHEAAAPMRGMMGAFLFCLFFMVPVYHNLRRMTPIQAETAALLP